MSNICTSNVTSGFIDLATFDELEKYMYGGPDATAYFVRETRKSTWFTQVPVVLSRASGNPGFGTEFSVSISRAGDYLLQTWLRLTTPVVTASENVLADQGLRWTRNFMHNLLRECCITFNDLVAARFDNYHLDFWTAFTVPAGKRNGYNNMIGNVPALTESVGAGGVLPAVTLNLPLPLFYTRDSGVALPTAALPYNDMRINFSLRRWQELLIKDDLTTNDPVANPGVALAGPWGFCATQADIVETNLELNNVQVWANYAIVSNDERKRMACAPRDILIEQVQSAPKQTFSNLAGANSFDIRFSHAIKVLFFGARNTTNACEWSNYTAASPVPDLGGVPIVDFAPPGAVDPILNTSLIYENTARLSQMGSDYYSLVNPWYHAPHIPLETGYHTYSYSLDFVCLDPMGSTNYGKLTNVSIVPEPSAGTRVVPAGAVPLVTPLVGGDDAQGANFQQTWEFCTTAVNNNIIRISGGALGFPVL